MKALQAWLVCLLLLGLALKGAAGQAHQHSMEIRSEWLDPGCQPPSSAPPPPPGAWPGVPALLSASALGGPWPAVCQAFPQSGPVTCSPVPLPLRSTQWRGSLPSGWPRAGFSYPWPKNLGGGEGRKGLLGSLNSHFPKLPTTQPWPPRPLGVPACRWVPAWPGHVGSSELGPCVGSAVHVPWALPPAGTHGTCVPGDAPPTPMPCSCSFLPSPRPRSCLVHGPQNQACGPLRPEESGPGGRSEAEPLAPARLLPPARRRPARPGWVTAQPTEE